MLGDVGLDLLPVVLVGADALAVAADWQQAAQPLDVRDQRQGALADVNARLQFVGMERFGQIVVSASFQAGDEILRAAARRQQNHIERRGEIGPSNAAAQFDAVDPRHHPVDDRERWRTVTDDVIPRRAAVAGDDHVETPALEAAAQQHRRHAVVVSDQDPHESCPRPGAWPGRSGGSMTANSVRESIGLDTYPSMPASRQRSRSPAIACAVMATMRTCPPEDCSRARIAAVASMPPIPGICRSISTTSYV